MTASGLSRLVSSQKTPPTVFGWRFLIHGETLVIFTRRFNSKRDFWSTKVVDARTVEGTDKQVYQTIIDEYGADSSQAHVEVYGMFPV